MGPAALDRILRTRERPKGTEHLDVILIIEPATRRNLHIRRLRVGRAALQMLTGFISSLSHGQRDVGCELRAHGQEGQDAQQVSL